MCKNIWNTYDMCQVLINIIFMWYGALPNMDISFLFIVTTVFLFFSDMNMIFKSDLSFLCRILKLIFRWYCKSVKIYVLTFKIHYVFYSMFINHMKMRSRPNFQSQLFVYMIIIRNYQLMERSTRYRYFCLTYTWANTWLDILNLLFRHS